ncbi:MAG: rRNA methyltransferase [Desulfobacteraceae bacterium]|nr:MAG: rRNA methyltransferase [Desulfobacteraceae bacterium]
MTTTFLICAPQFEQILADELALFAMTAEQSGPDWVLANRPSQEFNALFSIREFCFARHILDQPLEQPLASLPALAQTLCDFFCDSIKGEKIDGPWPLSIQAVGTAGLSKEKIQAVTELFLARLKKAVARVAKLAKVADHLPSGFHRGLFVQMIDTQKVFISRQCWSGGQRRMQFKSEAPSRSYLKVEEAYAILGTAPRQGETVVDLGAAPGGWSYSAAERGARVTAVDNGPLKDGARDHPLIEHLREDAFDFKPSPKTKTDWLFCDLVEEPHHVLRMIKHWLTILGCRYFIVNLKFGRSDPIQLLSQIYDQKTGLASYCESLRVRHLYHDREEITLMGNTEK